MSIDLEKISAQIGKTAANILAKYLNEELNIALTEEVLPKVKKALISAYDELASIEESQYPGPIVGEDLTSLNKWRGLFVSQLDREFSSRRITGTDVTLSLVDLSLLGYGREGEERRGPPESVDWLVYYIEGIAGEFAFITEEMYLSRHRTPEQFGRYGRFGDGFLISKESYEKEQWQKFTKLPFSSVRHPISGQPPYNGFEIAVNKLDLSTPFSAAVQKAVKRLSTAAIST